MITSYIVQGRLVSVDDVSMMDQSPDYHQPTSEVEISDISSASAPSSVVLSYTFYTLLGYASHVMVRLLNIGSIMLPFIVIGISCCTFESYLWHI